MNPPYGIKFNSNFQPGVSQRDAKENNAGITREPEQIQAYRDTWNLGIHSYLTYLRDRMLVSAQLLAKTGSFFIQISDDNLSYVCNLCDEVFGKENRCGIIAFIKTSGQSSSTLPSVADYIVWYAKDAPSVKYRELFAKKVPGEAGATQYTYVEDADGSCRKLEDGEAVASESRLLAHDNLTSQGSTSGGSESFEWRKEMYNPGENSHWKATIDGMRRLDRANRIMLLGKTLRYKRYVDDFPVTPLNNLWLDVSTSGFADKKRYVVQTNPRVIARCVLMTTDPGDLVLDPTCGAGTSAYVAEQWGRRWITCDTSRVALAIARQRLLTAKFPYYTLRGSSVREGFRYKTVPHVTLKSIANDVRLDHCNGLHEMDAMI